MVNENNHNTPNWSSRNEDVRSFVCFNHSCVQLGTQNISVYRLYTTLVLLFLLHSVSIELKAILDKDHISYCSFSLHTFYTHTEWLSVPRNVDDDHLVFSRGFISFVTVQYSRQDIDKNTQEFPRCFIAYLSYALLGVSDSHGLVCCFSGFFIMAGTGPLLVKTKYKSLVLVTAFSLLISFPETLLLFSVFCLRPCRFTNI